MKISAFLLASSVPAAAFTSVGQVNGRLSTKIASSDDVEKKLDEMAETWEGLKREEKEVEKTHDEKAAFNLLQNVLETAIDYTRMKEDVEEEHVESAHHKLEMALQMEESLKAMMDEAHQDAAYAGVVVGNYLAKDLPEDRELRRDLAVSEISHHIENYAEERLHEAREAELKAKDEEDEAKRSLEQLTEKEMELKATLEELKVFTKEKDRQHLDDDLKAWGVVGRSSGEFSSA